MITSTLSAHGPYDQLNGPSTPRGSRSTAPPVVALGSRAGVQLPYTVLRVSKQNALVSDTNTATNLSRTSMGDDIVEDVDIKWHEVQSVGNGVRGMSDM